MYIKDMKYCKMSLEDKQIAIDHLSELITKSPKCVIGSMKQHKEIIIDLIRQNRVFEYMEKREDVLEIEDRFTTSCANQLFKSLVENHTLVRNDKRSTKTIPRYWRARDQAIYDKLKAKNKDSTPVPNQVNTQ